MIPDLADGNCPAGPRDVGDCPVTLAALVVNIHSIGLSIATPAAFLAAVVTVAILRVFGVRADKEGVKVAEVLASSMTTVPGTSYPARITQMRHPSLSSSAHFQKARSTVWGRHIRHFKERIPNSDLQKGD
jgi:hypothetical protein